MWFRPPFSFQQRNREEGIIAETLMTLGSFSGEISRIASRTKAPRHLPDETKAMFNICLDLLILKR
jgi:hypothetical protein